MRTLVTLNLLFFIVTGLYSCGGEQSSANGNSIPIAIAGSDQTVLVGSVVYLDGSSSNDSDLDHLTFNWAFSSVPVGSQATLNNQQISQPQFTADLVGDYQLTLMVNDGTTDSAPDSVLITAEVGNIAPQANAGADQQVEVGSTVLLDGSQSSDANGDPLFYTWTIQQRPSLSSATLSNATTASPSFIADELGDYLVELTVDDQQSGLASDSVFIEAVAANIAPIAHAGSDQSITQGDTVNLDGSQSSDANLDNLTYQWGFSSKPVGSTAILSNDISVTPQFTPDLTGEYILSLTVNDGVLSSTSDSVVITVYAPFVIENLGVNFAPYDSGTNWAGDFIFGCTGFYKVFIEFGAIVDGGGSGPKILPTFEYIVDRTVTITAISDGEVVDVCWQSAITDPPDAGYARCTNISWDVDDYEITVVINSHPQYEVYYDHVVNPQVQAGDIISAGDPIGNPGITSHACEEFGNTTLLGRTEIMVNSGAQNISVCPFNHFDATTRATYEAAVTQMMGDWEQYLFDSYGISGAYDPNPPKSEQVYDDESHPIPGCALLEMGM